MFHLVDTYKRWRKKHRKNPCNNPQKTVPKEQPTIDPDAIKASFAKAYIKNYLIMQEDLLQAFDLEDFYAGDSEFVAKLCIEYSLLLFELSVCIHAATPHFKQHDSSDFYNHLYRTHLVCTQDAYTVVSVACENDSKIFSDELHFGQTSAYYTGVMSKKTIPVHYISMHPFPNRTVLGRLCNSLFDIFVNHLIHFLFTGESFISSDTPLLLISPSDIYEIGKSINPLREYAVDFVKELYTVFDL